MTQVVTVTAGVTEWLDGWQPPLDDESEILRAMLRKGRIWLRKAGLPTTNIDLTLLAYLCHREVSDLYHKGRLEDDYLAAGEVLDNYVTDYDAELLCQLIPLEPEPQIGGMTREVTAIHTALLAISGAMREAWEVEELCGGR